MRRSNKTIAVILMLVIAVAMASFFTVSALAAEADAAAEAPQDMWWLIILLLVIVDLELIAISTLGILIALERRKLENKALSVLFPTVLLAVVPAITPVICVVIGAAALVGVAVILFQVKALNEIKQAKPEAKKPAPAPEPEPEPEPEPIVEEAVIIEDNVDAAAVAEALAAPVVVLSEIDYDELVETEMEGGVEVVSVVWPERRSHNKLYRYSPNGEKLQPGDIVLVPTRDVMRERDIIRKAAVVRGNHFVDPETLHHKLKKIVGIVKKA